MAELGKSLAKLRKKAGLSQQELADKIGLTRSAIGMYETGRREPDLDALKKMADFFWVDLDTLTGYAEDRALPANMSQLGDLDQVPVVGRIACGLPILAQENIEAYVDLPRHIQADFALECKGDSMIGAGIRSGDVVYIHAQPEVENGQIAAVLIDEEEATLKRFYFDGRTAQLLAENTAYPPMVFVGAEIGKHVRIVGRAVAYTHSLK